MKLYKSSCSVSLKDCGTSKRVSLFNSNTHSKSYRVYYGPIQYSLPVDDTRYADIFTGEILRKPENERRAIRRARMAIIDLARLNKFEYFGTLTIDSEKHDVSNTLAVTESLLSSLKSYQKLAEDFKYIIVPEYGEKHHRLHFHFLMKGIRKKDLFNNEYNKLDFRYFKERFGFVQITPIRQQRADIERVAVYCGKYMSKDNIQVSGHRYYRSKGLLKVNARTIYSPLTAIHISKFMEKYPEYKYYDKECSCYDIPDFLFTELKEYVLMQFLKHCAYEHCSPLPLLHNFDLFI